MKCNYKRKERKLTSKERSQLWGQVIGVHPRAKDETERGGKVQ